MCLPGASADIENDIEEILQEMTALFEVINPYFPF